ncbi:serine integrase [Mycobacterium phage Trike]|uniref:integrase n=1 Tax=Mycobacterium phage Trike TaxID=1527536 RepID=UPI0004EF8C54|nr:integrase [Mycobacterium phage Trike]AIK69070.1 serine integrase [Mycobacterium phage Trike]
MRVLGRLRISRATEESTSIERQREIVEQWAAAHDHEIVGWAEDQDVSGSVDPFDAPALGPWLSEHRKHEWDILCAWKLDRLSRRAIPMNKLFGWMIDNDKTLVCVSENLDLGTWVGRMIANVIAGVAEGELEAIRERTTASHKKLRELGRWAGGPTYYGYVPKPRDSAGWELDIDPHAAGVLKEIIEKTIAGQSTESIVVELNERGELAPSDYLRKRTGKPLRGTKWNTSTIRHQLKSKTLLGHMTHKGQTVYDEAGLPVQKGPALIDRDTFKQLQDALEARGINRTKRVTGASPLLGVAVCDVCGGPMYYRSTSNRNNTGLLRQYICKHGRYGKTQANGGEPYNIIQADLLEAHVEEQFLWRMGDKRRIERVFVPGEGHQDELETAERAVEDLTSLLGTITQASARSRLLAQLAAAHDRLSRLEELPASEPRWEIRETGDTYAEAWQKATTEERRQIMLKAGVQMRVQMKDRVPRVFAGVLHSNWIEPTDIEERLLA